MDSHTTFAQNIANYNVDKLHNPYLMLIAFDTIIFKYMYSDKFVNNVY